MQRWAYFWVNLAAPENCSAGAALNGLGASGLRMGFPPQLLALWRPLVALAFGFIGGVAVHGVADAPTLGLLTDYAKAWLVCGPVDDE